MTHATKPRAIYVDVDDTLVRTVGSKRIPIPATVDHVRRLRADGAELYAWSAAGADYARTAAAQLGIAHCFTGFLPKPGVLIDDQDVADWPGLTLLHPLNCPAPTGPYFRQTDPALRTPGPLADTTSPPPDHLPPSLPTLLAPADPYSQLRPPAPTPLDELCTCPGTPPMVIRSTMSPNPLACVDCNGELIPESIGFSSALARDIAYWASYHDAFYFLWLDSGQFEDFAKQQLLDPSGPVNSMGLRIQAQLTSLRACYYWWFQDTSAADFAPLADCPRCHGALVLRHVKQPKRLCDACGILFGDD